MESYASPGEAAQHSTVSLPLAMPPPPLRPCKEETRFRRIPASPGSAAARLHVQAATGQTATSSRPQVGVYIPLHPLKETLFYFHTRHIDLISSDKCARACIYTQHEFTPRAAGRFVLCLLKSQFVSQYK